MAAIMMDKGCFNEVVKLPLPYLRKLNTRSAKLSIWTRSNLCLLHLAAVLIHIEHGRYWCYKLSLSWSPLLLTDYILQETFHLICQEEKWSRQGQYVAPVSLILYVHQYRSLVEQAQIGPGLHRSKKKAPRSWCSTSVLCLWEDWSEVFAEGSLQSEIVARFHEDPFSKKVDDMLRADYWGRIVRANSSKKL